MQEEQKNLYAPPKPDAEDMAVKSAGIWRDGGLLFCRRYALFPARCVKCNRPSQPPLVSYRLSWHHEAWYLSGALGELLYMALAPIVSRRATLDVGLCGRHRRLRLISRVAGWCGLAMIAALFFVTVVLREPWLLQAGSLMLLLLGLPLLLLAASEILRPRLKAARIDQSMVTVEGCGYAFLETLPRYVKSGR